MVLRKSAFSLILVVAYITFLGCDENKENSVSNAAEDIEVLLSERYQKLLDYPIDSTAFPRSYDPKEQAIKKVPSKDWTSGFFAGNLWQIYQLTGNDSYKEKAEKWTAFIEKEKLNDGTHDMGFKVYCSFGAGLDVSPNEEYKKIIVESAETLITRYNSTVQSLRSWDFNSDIWEYPVIIDNMMNLELLFEASKLSGDPKFHDIAIKHANTTLDNHFRADNSSYHVLVYDTLKGTVKARVTHQGIQDESSWARGQAWAIYGYTMAYRYTKDPAYLSRAQTTFDFFSNHTNLPEDGIPYWDFDDPKIPDSPRDVSAATIIASACFELDGYTNNSSYVDYANKVLGSLMSKNYILDAAIDAPFILDHSTGNWPKNDEIDGPIVYGDYYFLEALIRSKNL